MAIILAFIDSFRILFQRYVFPIVLSCIGDTISCISIICLIKKAVVDIKIKCICCFKMQQVSFCFESENVVTISDDA